MAEQVLSEQELGEALQTLPGWIEKDGWLRREYRTPGFTHTMMLANTVGFLAEAAWHHPDLVLGYAQLTVKLQTHRVGGITAMDVELARKIEDVATWKPDEESALDGFPKNWIR